MDSLKKWFGRSEVWMLIGVILIAGGCLNFACMGSKPDASSPEMAVKATPVPQKTEAPPSAPQEAMVPPPAPEEKEASEELGILPPTIEEPPLPASAPPPLFEEKAYLDTELPESGDVYFYVEPTPTPAEVEVSRYPTMETQDQVVVGQEFAVQISLTEELLTPEVQIKDGAITESGELRLNLPANQEAWDIDVALFANGFAFRDGKDTATIRLPLKGDSTPALFRLTPNPISDAQQVRKLYATFWYEGKYLAKVFREITVVRQPEARDSASQETSGAATRQQGKAAMVPSPEAQEEFSVPALTLFIQYNPDPSAPDTALIMIHSPFLQLTSGTFTVSPDLRRFLAAYYSRFSTAGRGLAINRQPTDTHENVVPTSQNIALLKGFGKLIYQKFAPPAFKTAFWLLKDKLGSDFDSIQIFTSEPLLPWELMRPTRADGSDEQDFLGVNFRIARWHVGQSDIQLESPPQVLNMEELLVIAPQYQGIQSLPSVEVEVAALQQIPNFHRMPGRFDDLLQLFTTDALKAGIIHFAGHGLVQVEATGGPEYAIRLEDGELDLMTWRGIFSDPQRVHPFFFFNACDIGQAHTIANFVDGWAPAILEGGGSGYIGGLWSLGDQGAADFAARFYQRLAQELQGQGRVNIAEILRQTRKQFYENGDPTFMAYVYYGYPDFQFKQPEETEKDKL